MTYWLHFPAVLFEAEIEKFGEVKDVTEASGGRKFQLTGTESILLVNDYQSARTIFLSCVVDHIKDK